MHGIWGCLVLFRRMCCLHPLLWYVPLHFPNLRCYFFLSSNWAMQFLLSRLTDVHNLGGFAVRNFLNLLFSQSDHYIRVSAFKKA